MPIHDSIVELIGETPMVRLPSVTSDCDAEIVGKAEFFNPLSSVKDRIGVNMIETAEEEGEIDEETVLVEPTSGNTGIALAYVCAARGYQLILTMPDTMSRERRALFRGLGAEVELVSSALGMHGAVDRAEEIVEERDDAYLLQQFQNPANPEAHAKTTAEEIWEQTEGEIDAIVTGVGTGGTISGVSRVLKERNPEFKAIAVEPAKSAVLSGEPPGPHKIQGIGAGFVPDNLDRDLLDDVVRIEDDEAFEMARRLGREEGILSGPSTGANVLAAIRVGNRPEFSGKRIVTTLCDSGERYLSTPVFHAAGEGEE